MDCINTYKVYVQTNAYGIITAINSSTFLPAPSDWMEIDEGTGDRYHHAQGHYLEKSLTDENGIFNYIPIDGKLSEGTAKPEEYTEELALRPSRSAGINEPEPLLTI